MTVRVGLLGIGIIGKTHLQRGYQALMADGCDIRLEACFDLSEENLALAGNIRQYTDLDAFFAQEQGKLDYVDICLPTFMHKEVAIRAMQAGFHVLCEKPMALNPEDAQQMCATAKETGKTLMIGQVLRFMRDFRLIYDYVHNQTLGKLRNIKYTSYGTGLPAGVNGWFLNRSLSGGPIVDVHVHDIDFLTWLLGKPESVCTFANAKAADGGYYAFSTNLRYPEQVFVNIQCDWALPANVHDRGRIMRLDFEKGYLIFNPAGNLFVAVDENGTETDLSEPDKPDGFYEEIRYFTDCLRQGSAPEKCPPEQTALAIRLIHTEIASADRGGEKIYM